MSSYGWQTTNPFIDTDVNNQSFTAQFQSFNPLPDDIFELENPMKPQPVDDSNFNRLNSQSEPPGNEFDDFSLFDLGISEHPMHNHHIPGVDPTKLMTTPSIEPASAKRGHKRKISGSAIFGFIGMGNDTQLAIPGMQTPLPVVFNEKKPLYYDLESQLNHLDYSQSHTPVIKPEDLVISNNHHNNNSSNNNKPEYIISSPSFKFPAHKDTSIQHTESQMRTPVKTVDSTDELSKQLSSFANKSEAKQMQFTSPNRSPLRSVFTSSPMKPKNLASTINTAIADDENDRTISEFTTPLKVKSSFINYKTPSPNKTPTKIAWFPTLATKKNNITEKMLKEQRVSPVRKKRPTITSTLATGTLDKYFIGPFNEKFICKFHNKETGSVCDREFSRISNVRAHVQTHLCDRPFVCTVCQKSFVRNHDLRRHTKVHEEFKFECPCGKKFPRHDAMKKHRLRNICKGGFINDDDDGSFAPTDPVNVVVNDSDFQQHENVKKQKTPAGITTTVETDLEIHQKRLLQLQQEQKMLENQIQQEQQQLNYVSLKQAHPVQDIIQPQHISQQHPQQLPNYTQQQLELFEIDQNFSFNFESQNLQI